MVVDSVCVWVVGIVESSIGVSSMVGKDVGVDLRVNMVVGRDGMSISNWSKRNSSNLHGLSNLMDWGRSLFSSKTSSSNTLEFSIKGSLGFSNIDSVIKVGIGNLSSLNIIVHWSKSSVLSSLGNVKSGLEGSFGSSNLSGVFNGSC